MLRIGLMGAAKIAPAAVVAPVKASSAAKLVAIAARDRAKAEKFAAKHKIPRILDSYEALLADPDVDAVYIPLPNGLHGRWAIKAVEAGKHVLCEKPLAANEAEAKAMADAADKAGRVMMEAFHYRYHPLAARMKEIVESGELGETREIFSTMAFPLPLFADIRYNFALGGGAMMDAGCYTVHMARLVGGGEPEVLSAKPLLLKPEIDRAMKAELRFPSGAIGHIHVSMWSWKLLELSLRVVGSKGEMRVSNPVAPQAFHKMTVLTPAGKRIERFDKRPTYSYQLDAFIAACETGAPLLTSARDGVGNMRVIDAIYRAAGMPLRQPG
jgi:predicted dehydrogenase